jgi:MoaA/NifB/PqqE/SkfB family radical SAM enzyme
MKHLSSTFTHDPTKMGDIFRKRQFDFEDIHLLSVIWNSTNRCFYDCVFCVTDSSPNCKRTELTLEEKLTVIKHLDGVECRVDLSGGEVMLDRKTHLPLIKELSRTIGRERVGISCSGKYIDEKIAAFLAEHVADVEMTMDAHPDRPFPNRPSKYHATAEKAARLLIAAGVKVGIQTVITRDHFENQGLLDELHGFLCSLGVSEWSLLRYFPSGRGANHPKLELSESENRALVERARRLCACRPDSPKLDIHYLMPGTDKDTSCRCVQKSVGIMPNGDVTACFWGLDKNGNIDERFLLGNIVKTPLAQILEGENSRYWNGYCGGCPLGEKERRDENEILAA